MNYVYVFQNKVTREVKFAQVWGVKIETAETRARFHCLSTTKDEDWEIIMVVEGGVLR